MKDGEPRAVIAYNVTPYLSANTRWPDLISLGAADTIMRALEDAGFAIVPVEPTEGMLENDEMDRIVLDHARALHSSGIDFARIYKAMIAASGLIKS
jgi:hypothetical protein